MLGDCFCCERVNRCRETSYKKIVSSYSCPLFYPVSEVVFNARSEALSKFGEKMTIDALLNMQEDEESKEEEEK